MGTTLIGFVIGLVAGASSGTELGAFAGGVLGMFVGLAVYAFLWLRVHLGDHPTIERHRVMCTPFGRPALADFEGDLETGRWSDVKRCALLRPAGRVDCDKGCLHQIRLAGVRPGGDCDCA